MTPKRLAILAAALAGAGVAIGFSIRDLTRAHGAGCRPHVDAVYDPDEVL